MRRFWGATISFSCWFASDPCPAQPVCDISNQAQKTKTHTPTHTHKHTDTSTQTRTHTHTHTHTHGYPHIELCRSHSLCLGLFGPELGLLWAGPCCQKSSRILMDTVLYFFIFERSPHVPKILHRTLVICVSSFLLFFLLFIEFSCF